MGILSWIVMGFVVGLLARAIMPGDDSVGFIMTIVLGVAGAFVGGAIARFFGFGDFTGFNFGSFIIATAGAIVILVGYRMLKKK